MYVVSCESKHKPICFKRSRCAFQVRRAILLTADFSCSPELIRGWWQQNLPALYLVDWFMGFNKINSGYEGQCSRELQII